VSLWQRLKGFVKNTILGATSTHGGVAGGMGSHSSPRRKRRRD
jgi:hypothetical protein